MKNALNSLIGQKILIPVLVFAVLSLLLVKPAYADTYRGDYKLCVANPSTVSPGQTVTFQIETKKPVRLTTNTIVVNNSTGETLKNQPTLDEQQETNIRTLTLGPFQQPGSYLVRSIDVTDSGGTGHCEVTSAFNVSGADTNIRLEQPAQTIEKNFTALPVLSITGLDPNKLYHISLTGWKGFDLDRDQKTGNNDGTQDWRPNSDGKIIATLICNNGQVNRTDCTENFGDGQYGITVKEINGPAVAFLSFSVRTGTSPGRNPCQQGSVCKTAIGDIPTNVTDFTGKVLSISIGLAGGIALIFMVIGAIRILTSSGDQQKLSGGREMIVAAVAGLLFLIFSILILRFIGTNLFPDIGF